MCLAVPAKIVAIEADTATIDVDGVRRPVNVSLVRDPKVGEYVIVHAGFAIQKWSESDVDEWRKIQEEMHSLE
ncbi:MAG: HypC/HybG/HupF family hydrogenase formation chaperone [Chitinivibrionales bacterium]|nr:HypC/HybG/HupF family hydrogenase formation chaperone [Chitinivibrionales bacterium]MBD3395597.1 HypC/HybG/HupF family hydrogenase formation chaperone [Chitinivibrionales bacterium]